MNYQKTKDKMVEWIRDWISKNGNDETKVVIGVSGGKDSSCLAYALVEALGKERVFGVLMPNGEQKDISDSLEVVNTLKIPYTIINIEKSYLSLRDEIGSGLKQFGIKSPYYIPQFYSNTPARLRMTTLYGIAACLGNARVINTCNLSETFVGWETYGGDNLGDFAPLAQLTTEEVIGVGEVLGVPNHLIHKAPSDGLCGNTDEDAMGFTYKELNDYIRKGIEGPNIERILTLHENSKFKRNNFKLPYFDPTEC